MNCKYSKHVGIAAIITVLLASNPVIFQSLPEHAYAQSTKLIVSAAQDPAQQNHFFGPQIVQIIIDDPGARDPDRGTSGLTVNGLPAQRVHLTDGLWYTFIAEDDSFLVFLDVMTDGKKDNIIAVSDADDADNRNAIGSINIQFSNADSFVREITETGGNTFVEVNKSAIFPSLPDPFTGTAINPDVDINSSAETTTDWPYIRLLKIQETDVVDVRFETTSVSLTFNSLSSSIQMGLDREAYPLNSEIIANFKDFMWNINPVEEDVVRFVLDKNNGTPVKVIYQPIRNFDPDGSGENLPDIFPVFSSLEFDQRQVLEIDGVENLRYKQAFDSALVEFPEESGRLIGEFATSQLPLVTFFERDPNGLLFETADESQGGRSKIFAGNRDTTASFDYFDIVDTAVVSVADAFVRVDKEVYDSGDRATFTVTDTDLNTRSNVSEEPDGILSKAFVIVGNPFPLTNNPLFNTLPKDSGGNFAASSIKEVDFELGSCGGAPECVDFDSGSNDFYAPTAGDIENRSPAKTDLLALDFTTDGNLPSGSGDLPTGFIVNTNVKLADIDDVVTFTMTKEELQNSADPFIRAVSRLVPVEGGTFVSADLDDTITVTFPKYNLIHIDLQKITGEFAKVFVEIEASDGVTTVAKMVDFEPFDSEDVDGNASTVSIDPLEESSGVGSFRVLDLVDGFSASANLNNVVLKFTVVVTDTANQPVPLTSADHQAVLDVTGLGVIRAEGSSKDDISVNAFENFVYRLALDEQGENSSTFDGRVDLMTVLHDDTVEKILQNIVATGDPLKIWLPNRFIPPNRLSLSYTDIDVTSNFRQVSMTFIYETKDATVSWDREEYGFNKVASLTIVDEDLNRKPDAIEQYSIPQDGFVFFEFDKKRADTQCQNLTPIPNECLKRFVESILRETGPNTGTFKAQITMPEKVLLEDGSIIRTLKSDIQVNYIDVRDASSNVNEFDDTASIRADVDTTPVQPEPAPTPEEPTVVEKGSTKLELNKGNYHPYDRVIITITSPEANKDIFRSDIIFISVKRQSAATGLTSYKLVETGIDTGVFSGYIDLQGMSGIDGGVGPKDGTLKIDAGDTLNVSYVALTADVPIQYHEGKVIWDKTRYVVGEKAKLRVIDTDMNKGPDRIDVIHVQLLIGNAKISVDLRETNIDTGVFAGEISFVDITAVKPGEVGVKSGDAVIALYDDETAPASSIEAAGLTGKILPVKASASIGDVMELVGTKRVVQTESKLVDENDKEVDRAKFRSSYKITSKVYNNTTQPLTFAFIVQIKDKQDITQFLELVTENVGAKESVTPAINWQPMGKGKYTIEIFAWQNLEAPSALSPVRKISITVE